MWVRRPRTTQEVRGAEEEVFFYVHDKQIGGPSVGPWEPVWVWRRSAWCWGSGGGCRSGSVLARAKGPRQQCVLPVVVVVTWSGYGLLLEAAFTHDSNRAIGLTPCAAA